MITPAQLINQTSGKTEYYTPQPIIEAARATMGGITLDPASSAAANERVGAARFFHEAQNGLVNWWGSTGNPSAVWMNHPFGRVSNPAWIKKLMIEWEQNRISQCCCITFACTSEKWFQPLLKHPQCFLTPRTNYLLPDGSVLKGVTKGSVVTYLGPNLVGFISEFSKLGTVKVVL